MKRLAMYIGVMLIGASIAQSGSGAKGAFGEVDGHR